MSIANSFAENLQNRDANQLHANFGFTAGVAESLLQSHAGAHAAFARPFSVLEQRLSHKRQDCDNFAQPCRALPC